MADQGDVRRIAPSLPETGGPGETDVVREVALAVERRDWDRARLLLHPYLHWTTGDGRTIRGRRNVLAHLEQAAPRGRPARHELRDGQVYRWVE